MLISEYSKINIFLHLGENFGGPRSRPRSHSVGLGHVCEFGSRTVSREFSCNFQDQEILGVKIIGVRGCEFASRPGGPKVCGTYKSIPV